MYPSPEVASPEIAYSEIASSGPRESVATAGTSIQFDSIRLRGCVWMFYLSIYNI